jgi:superfamily I DNA/RNA helicase
LEAESIVAALGTCGVVAGIVSDEALNVAERSAALADLVSVADIARLAEDLAARPLSPVDVDAADEGDEAIETAGSMAPIELLSLIGSKGLSAQHVMIIGCDDVNLQRVSPLTFFVAMTRARQSLHLLVSMGSGGAKDAHAYLGELPPDHCGCIEYTKSAPPKTHPRLAALSARFATWSRARR